MHSILILYRYFYNMNIASNSNNGTEKESVKTVKNKDGMPLPIYSSDYKKPRTPLEIVAEYRELSKRVRVPHN